MLVGGGGGCFSLMNIFTMILGYTCHIFILTDENCAMLDMFGLTISDRHIYK